MLAGDEFFSFLSLPQEIQVIILRQLSLRDISAITEVSHALHDLVRRTVILQYPIELVACGMCDNQHSATAIAERLLHLQQHDQAWRTLSWSDVYSFSVAPGGGTCARNGLVLVAKDMTHPELGVEVCQLPAKTRNISQHIWTIKPFHVEVPPGPRMIYEADASQDLLIIRHGATHEDTFFSVFTLSDGLPHPLAALPTFHISNSANGDARTGTSSGAHVYRDWIFLLEHRYEVYNWKTGDRVLDLSRLSMLDECAFVGGDRYLATLCVGVGPSQAGLLIYELPDSDPGTPLQYPAEIPILALLLPEIDTDQGTETHWELVGGTAHSAIKSDVVRGGDFAAPRDDTLLMILFRIGHQWYELVVPAQRLLEFLPHPATVSMNANMLALREVLWSEWGPANTRVRRMDAREDHQERRQLYSSLFGMRRVFHHPILTSSGEMVARVEDYHPNRVRRAAAREGAHTIHHGDTAEGRWLEEDELTTELLFMEMDMLLPSRWQRKPVEDVCISINEDGIIVAERDNGEHDEAFTL